MAYACLQLIIIAWVENVDNNCTIARTNMLLTNMSMVIKLGFKAASRQASYNFLRLSIDYKLSAYTKVSD